MTEFNTFPKLYTLTQVAEQTGFSLRQLQLDCRAGRIEHVHRGRGRFMTGPQIQELVAGHTSKPPVAAERSVKDELVARELKKILRRRH